MATNDTDLAQDNDEGTEETGEMERGPVTVAFYPGCVTATEQYAYELSMRNLAPKLDIELVELDGVTCCGAPLRSINLNLPLYFSARTLAMCEKEGLDVLTLCPQCHLAFSEAKKALCENDELRAKINGLLASEGLTFTGDLTIWHTIDLLHDRVGLETIAAAVTTPLDEIAAAAADDAEEDADTDDAEKNGTLTLAAHYGCHLIRPSAMGRPDHAERPAKLDTLVEAIGGATEDYPQKLDCCGAPLMVNEADSALTLAGQKLDAVATRGFDALVTVCPWGHRQFDTKQQDAAAAVGKKFAVPVVYYTQLLGLALGLDAKEVGLELNLSPVAALGLGGDESE